MVIRIRWFSTSNSCSNRSVYKLSSKKIIYICNYNSLRFNLTNNFIYMGPTSNKNLMVLVWQKTLLINWMIGNLIVIRLRKKVLMSSISVSKYLHIFSCYYCTDSCHWLLNWSYVNKYFDSESYTFYIEIKKDFLLSPIYHHLKGIFAIRHPTEENQQSVSRFACFFLFFFSKQTCLKNEGRNLLH